MEHNAMLRLTASWNDENRAEHARHVALMASHIFVTHLIRGHYTLPLSAGDLDKLMVDSVKQAVDLDRRVIIAVFGQ